MYRLAASPNGNWLASVSYDATIRIWNPLTGQPIAMMRLDGPIATCCWIPETSTIVVGGSRDGIYAFDLIGDTAPPHH